MSERWVAVIATPASLDMKIDLPVPYFVFAVFHRRHIWYRCEPRGKPVKDRRCPRNRNRRVRSPRVSLVPEGAGKAGSE